MSASFLSMFPPVLYLALVSVTIVTLWLSGVTAENYTHVVKNNHLISEIFKFKNCSKRAVYCNGNFSRNSAPTQCFCDDGCHIFRDCCADVVELDNLGNKTPAFKEIPADRWRCLPLNVGEHSSNLPTVYMVSSCPRGHALSADCDKSDLVDVGWNYVHDVPLMDAQSGVWYRNVYCALCHDVGENLAPVNLTLRCSDNATWDEISTIASYEGDLKWSWNSTEGAGSCRLEVTPLNWPTAQRRLIAKPPTIPGFYRPCVSAVDSCPASWGDAHTADRCGSYAYFVKPRAANVGNTVYKNPHCGVCNGHSAFVCFHIAATSFRRTWHPPSLSMIMNFQWDFEGETEWRSATAKCSPPYGLYDAINNRCQRLKDTCGYNYRHESHKCPSKSGDLVLTCPKIQLRPEQFKITDNGSLLKIGDESYPEIVVGRDYFEVLDNGSAAVCLFIGERDDLGSARVTAFSDHFEGLVSCICFAVSITCLLLHIVAYATVPKLRNLPGKNLLALTCCLLFAQLLFVLGSHPVIEVDADVCVAIATATHFLFLAAFLWMNVMSFDIWRKFSSCSHSGSPASLHRKYSLYAWTTAGAIVLVSTLVDRVGLLPEFARPNYGRGGLCWIGSPLGIGIFFAAPIILIVCANLFLFTTTVVKIRKQKRESASYIKKRNRDERLQCRTRNANRRDSPPDRTSGMSGRRDQIRAYLYIKLFMIMGLTWVFGVVNGFVRVQILWYPFIILNALQGAFIFFMFDFKRSIGAMVWEGTLGGRYQVPGFLKNSNSNSKTESGTHTSSKGSNNRGSKTLSATEFISTEVSTQRDVAATDRLVRLRAYSRSTSYELGDATDASTEGNYVFNNQQPMRTKC